LIGKKPKKLKEGSATDRWDNNNNFPKEHGKTSTRGR